MLGIKNLNRCDIYIALNVLYSMQGLLYPQGAINQILQLVIIMWGLEILLKYLLGSCKQTKTLKSISTLVFMYSLYGGVLIIWGNPFIEHILDLPPRYLYLQSSLRSLLRIYVFYHYASIGYLTVSRIRLYAILFLITFIPQYYYQQVQIMYMSDREEVTNNMGYTFLAVSPMLFFFNKKPLVQYALLAITLLFIIMAMKRGPIGIASVVIAALIWSNLFSGNKIHKFWAVFFSLLLIMGIVYVISYMMAESEYFVRRIEQTLSGDSSGRDDIYGTLWQRILDESNIFYFLFGRGADATWAVAGNYAHQDWLETLCNNGLVGGIILFYFYVRFFKDAYLSRRLFSKNFYYAYMMLFFIAFSQTLFSMSIQSMSLSLSLLLGYFSYWVCRPYKEIAQEELV